MQKYFVNQKIQEIIETESKKPSAIAAKAGMGRDTFSKIIHKKRVVYADELPAICAALGISMDSLFEDWKKDA